MISKCRHCRSDSRGQRLFRVVDVLTVLVISTRSFRPSRQILILTDGSLRAASASTGRQVTGIPGIMYSHYRVFGNKLLSIIKTSSVQYPWSLFLKLSSKNLFSNQIPGSVFFEVCNQNEVWRRFQISSEVANGPGRIQVFPGSEVLGISGENHLFQNISHGGSRDDSVGFDPNETLKIAVFEPWNT